LRPIENPQPLLETPANLRCCTRGARSRDRVPTKPGETTVASRKAVAVGWDRLGRRPFPIAHIIQTFGPLTDGREGAEFLLRRSVHARGGWFGVVPGAAAASLLATLSFASLCLCSDEPSVVRASLDGCGASAQRHVDLAASVEAAGDACLGPCLDVRMLAAGVPGDERQPVSAPGLVAATDWMASGRSRHSPLPARPRENSRTPGHLDYTILRC
jgi:hypothetical protein